MLTHQDVVSRRWIEAYVRSQLAPADRLAFEEHYLACDLCFKEVRVMEKFIAGVRHAARTGVLDAPPAPPRSGPKRAVVAGGVALAALALVNLYLVVVRMPAQAAAVSQAQGEAAAARDRLAEVERLAALAGAIDADAPVVALDARKPSDSAIDVTTAPGARQILLVIQLPPTSATQRVDVAVSTADGRSVAALRARSRHPSGTIAIALNAADLPDGSYVVHVVDSDTPATVVGEFRITVVRK